MSGVLLRGSGIKFDLRKDKPYEIYNLLDFSIPVGSTGDCYDRYMVRMEEMRQSIRIINQVLEKMTGGHVKFLEKKIVPQRRNDLKSHMEGTINQYKMIHEPLNSFSGFSDYTCAEAPKGEFGLYLNYSSDRIFVRCKIKAPGFFHLQTSAAMTNKHFVADVVTIIGTQDIVFGEVDR